MRQNEITQRENTDRKTRRTEIQTLRHGIREVQTGKGVSEGVNRVIRGKQENETY